MNVIQFTPEGDGKKALLRSVEGVADDCGSWLLLTWDDHLNVNISFQNDSRLPTDCLPEWVSRKIVDYLKIKDFRAGGTS